MNLRVDLILPSEQRSGSLLNVKSLIRMFSIIGPVAIAMLVAWLAMNIIKVNAELSNLEAQWEEASKREKEGEELQKTVNRNKEILKEFNGWSTSHLKWYGELTSLAKATPPPIQITSLVTRETIELEIDIPVRRITVLLQGKAAGRNPSDAVKFVDLFRSRLAQNPMVEEATVADFGADTSPGAGAFDRLFRIECKYKARNFR